MVVFILQAAILIAIAFIVGCMVGSLARRFMAEDTAMADTGTAPAAAPQAMPTGAPAGIAATDATATARTGEPLQPAAPAADAKAAREPTEPADDAATHADAPPPGRNEAETSQAAPGKPATAKPGRAKSAKAGAGKATGSSASAGKNRSAAKAKPADAKGPAKSAARPAAERAASGKASAGKAAAAGGAAPDNLKLIKGIGPQNEKALNARGITRFEQIAGWTDADAERWGEELAFPGRIEREDWIGQARTLAQGGATEFSRRKTGTGKRSS
ncbi:MULTISPECIES: hypothetical protein [unclassified Roseitalea]|uniref:hypothetical protein n=1 Tax=unclassified Roseitalea TaxID=2639107 RepID=UPI00273EFA8E|nr:MULTISPECIES: hypothetical protein [unclassified Roseitalea]